jgi:hypothetical protein
MDKNFSIPVSRLSQGATVRSHQVVVNDDHRRCDAP